MDTCFEDRTPIKTSLPRHQYPREPDRMKAAVLTVLLFVAYAKSQDILPAKPLPVLPLKCPYCALLKRSVLVTKGSCSGYITVGYCSGCCPGSVSYSPDKFLKVTRSCLCCTETKIAAKAVKLSCPLHAVSIYKYYTITGCSCSSTKCSADPYQLSALPSLEAAEVSEAAEVPLPEPDIAA